MHYYKTNLSALDVYLERRERKQYVGRLTRQPDQKFHFAYDEAYQRMNNSISIGPSLPLVKKEFLSTNLFPEFLDRIPSSQNHAYEDYCNSVGISVEEDDLMVLLIKLGKRGPSSFIIEPVVEDHPADVVNNIRGFLPENSLSQQDFANLLDIPITSLSRLLTGASVDRTLLRLIDLYLSSPNSLVQIFSYTQRKLTEKKRARVFKYLEKYE
ncbi:MAG: HipA N-terminal domain-containing protein [Pseudomonadota bacterium]